MRSSWTDRDFMLACVAMGVFEKDSIHYKDFETAMIREINMKIQESGDGKSGDTI